TPGSFKEGFLGVLDDVPGMTLGAWQLRPESSGYVRARSTDLFEAPEIQPNYLTSEKDREVLLSGQKLIRRLLNETSLKNYVVEEIIPGPSVVTDDDLRAYARRQALAARIGAGNARRRGGRCGSLRRDDSDCRVHLGCHDFGSLDGGLFSRSGQSRQADDGGGRAEHQQVSKDTV
ncbi:MAG: hypothetical protein B7Z20_01920, partial [Sphingobium sp. 32-64-5]